MGAKATEGTGAYNARELGKGWKISPSVAIPAGQTATLADIRGFGAVKHIWMTCKAPDMRSLILRIYWEGQERPAVEVPLGDFFASATEEYQQLSSLAVCVNARNGLNCYWEMPYRTRCWRSGKHFLPLQDDISSVAFWYSDNLHDHYPKLPERDELEIL